MENNKNKRYKCPYCGGNLSELRYNKLYHCYSCHFEFSKERIENEQKED